jgi:serine phosphatase RsbU (regulator of sigma subunit)
MNNPNWPDDATAFAFINPALAGGPDALLRTGEPARRVRVLLVEDNPGDARLIREYLTEVEGLQFDLEGADRLAAAQQRLLRGDLDVVLLDLSLPDSRGLNTFVRLHAAVPEVPIVVLTGFDDELQAVKAVQEGAEDYLIKGYVNSNLLARSLRYAIERTRRRQAERRLRQTEEKMHVAREIQRRLFPARPPQLPGLDLAGASFPADVTGGDYFDYVPLLDGGWGLAIGDVTGHGFGPALLMASTRAYLRALAQTQADPGAVLTLVNRVLGADLGPDCGADHFVTMLLARLQGRSLTYASAGHAAGYVLDGNGRVKRALPSTGLPLGIHPEHAYASSAPVELAEGDLVLLLTDGVVEARVPDGTAFGSQRALDIVRYYHADPAAQVVDNLYHAVRAFAQNEPQVDDITVLALKVTGPACALPDAAAGRQ